MIPSEPFSDFDMEVSSFLNKSEDFNLNVRENNFNEIDEKINLIVLSIIELEKAQTIAWNKEINTDQMYPKILNVKNASEDLKNILNTLNEKIKINIKDKKNLKLFEELKERNEKIVIIFNEKFNELDKLIGNDPERNINSFYMVDLPPKEPEKNLIQTISEFFIKPIQPFIQPFIHPPIRPFIEKENDQEQKEFIFSIFEEGDDQKKIEFLICGDATEIQIHKQFKKDMERCKKFNFKSPNEEVIFQDIKGDVLEKLVQLLQFNESQVWEKSENAEKAALRLMAFCSQGTLAESLLLTQDLKQKAEKLHPKYFFFPAGQIEGEGIEYVLSLDQKNQLSVSLKQPMHFNIESNNGSLEPFYFFAIKVKITVPLDTLKEIDLTKDKLFPHLQVSYRISDLFKTKEEVFNILNEWDKKN